MRLDPPNNVSTMVRRAARGAATTLALAVVAGACGSDPDILPPADGDPSDTPGLDPALFVDGALVAPATTEPCVLSGGTRTTCHRLEIAGAPASREIGPFCPTTIDASAEEGGIWFDGGGEVYELDGAFIVNVGALYGDPNWQLYDPETGEVNVTDTRVACEAAARPDVDPMYRNHCVECSIDYYGGGVAQTALIPVNPIPLPSPAAIGQGNVGVSLQGVALGPPAPVHAILGAYTIAAFDDCGGHVNPVEGYHYHAATPCNETVVQDDGHAALIGYAMDGHAIFGTRNGDGTAPAELDACRGHSDEARGYHYHAADAGENMFIACVRGERGTIG